MLIQTGYALNVYVNYKTNQELTKHKQHGNPSIRSIKRS
jgi:hypothetical protein